MKPIHTPVAIRMEFVGFDEPSAPRAARSLLRRRLAGAKRIEAVLKPEAAAALIYLRKRTGSTYLAIIEGLLLAEHARDLRRAG